VRWFKEMSKNKENDEGKEMQEGIGQHKQKERK
jgi:hypothetical protein